MENTVIEVPEMLKTLCIAWHLDPEDKSLLPPEHIVDLVDRAATLTEQEAGWLTEWINETEQMQQEALSILDRLPLFDARTVPPTWFGQRWVLTLQAPWSGELRQAISQGRKWLEENQ